ncbi:Histidine kinase-, DNA gyrase B-, and HSP90-like ATPase [Chryseolinea serpens]|uniref:histidine kinase n=1 Tax=Chryseolinea serpens TaxID=947013 RepID=A0A1M5JZT1_9BACT|nr:HAMP domain-containing sensor histidine kinase [Chryseolinea serpens]SHG45810.1 Histidine kinase-, DNA gyrase B-, and HSP90-like ATPase [Chryseolinea serpens]
MKSFIQRILYAGIHRALSRSLMRTIVLTNALALITIALASTTFLHSLIRNHGRLSVSSSINLGVMVLLCGILVLNDARRFNLSRFILSVLVPVACCAILFLPRWKNPDLFHYLPRSPQLFCVILATSIIPLMVFSVRERRLLIPAVGINILILITIDPTLFYFSADRHGEYGFYRYFGNNLTILAAGLFLMGAIVFLKNLFEDFELLNERLIDNLNDKNAQLEKNNRDLYRLNQDIETQNEEIQAQSEELMQSQESLMMANHKIEEQKVELENQNELLEHLLAEKKQDLVQTNQQLVSRNSELEQFSYTVSHNLRGPVASLLGLINIINLTENEDDKKHILKLIEQSALSLETVIKDLNKIIDIRHDKFNINERVELEEVLSVITESLKTFIVENNIAITHDFKHGEAFVSIRAYLSSILYNLISNAIQYRSPERKPTIHITSVLKDRMLILEVADNGLGIDLTRYQQDLYKLYKRFHDHIPGKGLGLYLVKQQVEKLNGSIEVESVPHQGTTFRILLPV